MHLMAGMALLYLMLLADPMQVGMLHFGMENNVEKIYTTTIAIGMMIHQRQKMKEQRQE
jgi:hypothetical protein